MQPFDEQNLESYLPAYDAIPEKWEDARGYITEQLKRIANEVNLREIGWFLDQELISGKQFIPSANDPTSSPQQFRTVLRIVVDVSPLVVGVNPPFLHGITFDSNFTLIDLWVAATNSGTLTARVLTDNDVSLTSTQILITSPGVFDRAFCIIEYIQEI